MNSEEYQRIRIRKLRSLEKDIANESMYKYPVTEQIPFTVCCSHIGWYSEQHIRIQKLQSLEKDIVNKSKYKHRVTEQISHALYIKHS